MKKYKVTMQDGTIFIVDKKGNWLDTTVKTKFKFVLITEYWQYQEIDISKIKDKLLRPLLVYKKIITKESYDGLIGVGRTKSIELIKGDKNE